MMGFLKILGKLALMAAGGILAGLFGRIVINVIDGKPIDKLLEPPKKDVILRIELGGPEGKVT